ncbi:MAG: hypothetical protein ACR2M0_00320 [Chloroflexia bacterium]
MLTGGSVTRFQKDVDLVWQIDPAALAAAGVKGWPPRVYTLDEQQSAWVEILSRWDAASGSLIVTTPHFSLYAVGDGFDMVNNYLPTVNNFETNLQSGSASIQYPLTLPPGPGGFSPKVSLSYNSGAADLVKLRELPTQGRRRYRSQADLESVVAARIGAAGLSGVVTVRLREASTSSGKPCWVVEEVTVPQAAWQALLERMGWQVCLTSTTAQHYSAAAMVETYHGQSVLERDFARLKSRAVHIRPVYVRDEQRIAGLVWLLMVALRVLVICEARLRAELAERDESLVGRNPASRTQHTTRPTTERVLDGFRELTLTRWQGEAGEWHGHVTLLNATQQQILALLGLPADLYSRLAHAPPKLAPHLPE